MMKMNICRHRHSSTLWQFLCAVAVVALAAGPVLAEPTDLELMQMLKVIDDRQANTGDYRSIAYLETKEKGKDDARLAFQASASRIEQAKKITVAVANGADAIGPFYLGRWESNGRSGWQLTNAPSTPSVIPALSHSAQTTPAPAAAPGVSIGGDDDIPFAPSLV